MKSRQQGVALLVMLLILALMMTIAAGMTERSGRTFLRTMALGQQLQAKWYDYAAEAMAIRILQRDRQNSPLKTHLAQNWAQAEWPFRVEEGDVWGRIADAQTCFNLNAINNSASGQESMPYAASVFQQLLLNLQVRRPLASRITAALRRRVGQRRDAEGGHAAESLAASADRQPLVDISELRILPGMDARLYRQLLPSVCVLPDSSLQINVNTLPASQAPLLAALFLTDPASFPAEKILAQRPPAGWDSVAAFLALSSLQERHTAAALPILTVNSNYFWVRVHVRLGDSLFNSQILLQWQEKGFRHVQRQQGLTAVADPQ